MKLETELLSFDDVIITPKFSSIKSRKDVDLSITINRKKYNLPVISSNMDTITEVDMVNAMEENGAIACLHRFWNIKDNVNAFNKCPTAWVSVGVGNVELNRAKALYEADAKVMILDVAHGAAKHVAEQYVDIKNSCPDIFLIVGNFATYESFLEFKNYLQCELDDIEIDGVKLGIGNGSHCSTQIVTGCGYSLFETILDFRNRDYNGLIIADGGMKNSGDVAKSLAAGADLCMTGYLLAGTKESAGFMNIEKEIEYRGSASKESYNIQNKAQTYISPEGERSFIPYKGSVTNVLSQIAGGLRSALSYVGACDIVEFRNKAEFNRISKASYIEGTPHGKR